MKKLIIFLCLASHLNSIAQEKVKNFSEQIGVTASTTAAYRITGIDTIIKNAFTLAPYFRIMHKSGLGLNYTINTIVSGAKKNLFMQTASAFYEEYDRPVNLNFSYTHFFFTSNEAIPYTPITNELHGYIAYENLWLAPAVAASIGFGQDENNQTQSVINLAAGATHNFNFSTKNIKEADIAPSIFLNAGSNGYYSFLQTSRYITQSAGNKGFLKSKGRGRRNGNGGTTGTTTNQTTATAFTLNNIELNIYSSFKFGHFEIVPDWSIFVPVSADSQLSAYWQLKLGYNFGE